MQTPNPDELIAVFENIDRTPVEMAHDYLKDAGIESFIFGASVFGSSVLMPTRLMVRADAAKDARERLTELGMVNGDSVSHSPAAPLRWFGIPKSRLRDEARRRMTRRRTGVGPPPAWVRVLEVSFCGGVIGFGLFYLVVNSVFHNLEGAALESIWERSGFAIGASFAALGLTSTDARNARKPNNSSYSSVSP